MTKHSAAYDIGPHNDGLREASTLLRTEPKVTRKVALGFFSGRRVMEVHMSFENEGKGSITTHKDRALQSGDR